MPNIKRNDKFMYLYGIINSPIIDKIDAVGVTNNKPYIISFKDMGIIVSTCINQNIDTSYENLSKHDEVVYELMKKYCILPVAFNTLLESEIAINDFLTQKYDQIKLNFKDLINKYEMGLKVFWDIDKIKQNINNEKEEQKLSYFTADTPAKKYLQEKLDFYYYQNRVERKAELIKEKIIQELNLDDCCIYKIKLLQSKRIVINGAFLINIDMKEKFIDSVHKLKDNNIDLAFLLSGPWAPYNFVKFKES